jgi:hypothetical protein
MELWQIELAAPPQTTGRGPVLGPELHEVISKMREMYTLATLYNTNCTKSFYRYVHNFSILSFACFVPIH